MEGDREGERAVSDLRRLEPCAVHAMQDSTQDELVADEDAIINLWRIEVDPARPSEIGAERLLHPAGLDVDTDTSRPDPKRSTAQILGPCECADRIEVAGCEFLANEMRQPQATRSPLHRPSGLQPKEVRSERRGLHLDALRGHRGECFRPRK